LVRRQELRPIEVPFVALGPSGVAIRDRLKHLTPQDEKVLRLVGAHLGSLASKDLKARCDAGLDHHTDRWAERKRVLTQESSSRWAGSITKATHDQWALARRGQLAHIRSLEAGIAAISHRLSLPVGERGGKRVPGGYRSEHEWFHKARRLHVLQDRLERERADRAAGRVRVVRGGKRLLGTRHHLHAAQLTEPEWRERWEASRRFLQADGESGKRYGNETIRISPEGEVSLKLPTPLKHLANAPHGRYVLACKVRFPHRGTEWADRVAANRAVAYRIHYDVARGRWYITASWHYQPTQTIPLEAALTEGVIGVDTNADHIAAWRLDRHGNPIGNPRRFSYDLSGHADQRDAQVRHASAALGQDLRRHSDRDRGPGLRRGQDPRKARTPTPVPPADLGHAHRQAPRPPHIDGRCHRHQHHRRRPGLHQQVGRPALAKAPHQQEPHNHSPRRCRRGDRKARPRAPGPATDDTAPHPPERWVWASDRPG
jgi:hypothetical protein